MDTGGAMTTEVADTDLARGFVVGRFSLKVKVDGGSVPAAKTPTNHRVHTEAR
jgi:hypothetical protein